MLKILLLLTNVVISQSISGSSCAIMNRAMYIAGGKANNADYTNLIQVNLTQRFNVADFKIQDGDSVSVSSLGNNQLPNYGAVFGSGAVGSKLWMMGSSDSTGSTGDIRCFDLLSGTFNNNPINSKYAPSIRRAFAWSQYDGKFYACGGNVTQTGQLSAEFWQLDIKNGWNKMPTIDSIPAVHYHQATIVLDRYFMVLGGQLQDGTIRDLTQVWIFDFKKNSWRIQNTSGGDNIKIVKFTPIAVKDKIIIQGGANNVDSTAPGYLIYPGLFILDTNTWKWTQKNLFGPNGEIINTARAGYSAWKIGNQIVQFLGEFNSSLSTPSQAQIISLSNFIVVKTYMPPDPDWFNQIYKDDDYNDNSSNKTKIIIGVVVGVLVLVLLAILLIYLYRRRVKILEREFMPADPILSPINIAPEVIWAGEPASTTGLSISLPNRFSATQHSGSTATRTSQLPGLTASSPPKEQVNPLFDLQYTTIIPGENRDDVINARFDS